MSDKAFHLPTRQAARELANVCAQIRAAHPDVDWRVPVAQVRPPTRVEQIACLYRDGLSGQAIAERLGISIHTVSTLITRARKAGTWPEGLRHPRGRRKVRQS